MRPRCGEWAAGAMSRETDLPSKSRHRATHISSMERNAMQSSLPPDLVELMKHTEQGMRRLYAATNGLDSIPVQSHKTSRHRNGGVLRRLRAAAAAAPTASSTDEECSADEDEDDYARRHDILDRTRKTTSFLPHSDAGEESDEWGRYVHLAFDTGGRPRTRRTKVNHAKNRAHRNISNSSTNTRSRSSSSRTGVGSSSHSRSGDSLHESHGAYLYTRRGTGAGGTRATYDKGMSDTDDTRTGSDDDDVVRLPRAKEPSRSRRQLAALRHRRTPSPAASTSSCVSSEMTRACGPPRLASRGGSRRHIHDAKATAIRPNETLVRARYTAHHRTSPTQTRESRRGVTQSVRHDEERVVSVADRGQTRHGNNTTYLHHRIQKNMNRSDKNNNNNSALSVSSLSADHRPVEGSCTLVDYHRGRGGKSKSTCCHDSSRSSSLHANPTTSHITKKEEQTKKKSVHHSAPSAYPSARNVGERAELHPLQHGVAMARKKKDVSCNNAEKAETREKQHERPSRALAPAHAMTTLLPRQQQQQQQQQQSNRVTSASERYARLLSQAQTVPMSHTQTIVTHNDEGGDSDNERAKEVATSRRHDTAVTSTRTRTDRHTKANQHLSPARSSSHGELAHLPNGHDKTRTAAPIAQDAIHQRGPSSSCSSSCRVVQEREKDKENCIGNALMSQDRSLPASYSVVERMPDVLYVPPAPHKNSTTHLRHATGLVCSHLVDDVEHTHDHDDEAMDRTQHTEKEEDTVCHSLHTGTTAQTRVAHTAAPLRALVVPATSADPSAAHAAPSTQLVPHDTNITLASSSFASSSSAHSSTVSLSAKVNTATTPTTTTTTTTTSAEQLPGNTLSTCAIATRHKSLLPYSLASRGASHAAALDALQAALHTAQSTTEERQQQWRHRVGVLRRQCRTLQQQLDAARQDRHTLQQRQCELTTTLQQTRQRADALQRRCECVEEQQQRQQQQQQRHDAHVAREAQLTHEEARLRRALEQREQARRMELVCQGAQAHATAHAQSIRHALAIAAEEDRQRREADWRAELHARDARVTQLEHEARQNMTEWAGELAQTAAQYQSLRRRAMRRCERLRRRLRLRATQNAALAQAARAAAAAAQTRETEWAAHETQLRHTCNVAQEAVAALQTELHTLQGEVAEEQRRATAAAAKQAASEETLRVLRGQLQEKTEQLESLLRQSCVGAVGASGLLSPTSRREWQKEEEGPAEHAEEHTCTTGACAVHDIKSAVSNNNNSNNNNNNNNSNHHNNVTRPTSRAANARTHAETRRRALSATAWVSQSSTRTLAEGSALAQVRVALEEERRRRIRAEETLRQCRGTARAAEEQTVRALRNEPSTSHWAAMCVPRPARQAACGGKDVGGKEGCRGSEERVSPVTHTESPSRRGAVSRSTQGRAASGGAGAAAAAGNTRLADDAVRRARGENSHGASFTSKTPPPSSAKRIHKEISTTTTNTNNNVNHISNGKEVAVCSTGSATSATTPRTTTADDRTHRRHLPQSHSLPRKTSTSPPAVQITRVDTDENHRAARRTVCTPDGERVRRGRAARRAATARSSARSISDSDETWNSSSLSTSTTASTLTSPQSTPPDSVGAMSAILQPSNSNNSSRSRPTHAHPTNPEEEHELSDQRDHMNDGVSVMRRTCVPQLHSSTRQTTEEAKEEQTGHVCVQHAQDSPLPHDAKDSKLIRSDNNTRCDADLQQPHTAHRHPPTHMADTQVNDDLRVNDNNSNIHNKVTVQRGTSVTETGHAAVIDTAHHSPVEVLPWFRQPRTTPIRTPRRRAHDAVTAGSSALRGAPVNERLVSPWHSRDTPKSAQGPSPMRQTTRATHSRPVDSSDLAAQRHGQRRDLHKDDDAESALPASANEPERSAVVQPMSASVIHASVVHNTTTTTTNNNNDDGKRDVRQDVLPLFAHMPEKAAHDDVMSAPHTSRRADMDAEEMWSGKEGHEERMDRFQHTAAAVLQRIMSSRDEFLHECAGIIKTAATQQRPRSLDTVLLMSTTGPRMNE